MDAQLARSPSPCSSLCQSASVLEVDTIINIVLSTPVYFWLGFNSRNKSLDPPRAIHMSFLIQSITLKKMQIIPGRLAVCLRMTVSQLVKPHRASCLLGQLNKVCCNSVLV